MDNENSSTEDSSVEDSSVVKKCEKCHIDYVVETTVGHVYKFPLIMSPKPDHSCPRCNYPNKNTRTGCVRCSENLAHIRLTKGE